MIKQHFLYNRELVPFPKICNVFSVKKCCHADLVGFKVFDERAEFFQRKGLQFCYWVHFENAQLMTRNQFAKIVDIMPNGAGSLRVIVNLEEFFLNNISVQLEIC
jgi:hypothetical protein